MSGPNDPGRVYTPDGNGSGGGSAPVFTYKRGAFSQGSVFSNLKEAYVAAFATGAYALLAVDDIFAPGLAVSGNTGLMDLGLIDIVAARSQNGGTPLTFQTGSTIKRFRRLYSMNLSSTSTAPVLTNSAQTNTVYMEASTLNAGSLAPFVNQTAAGVFVPFLQLGSALLGTAGERAVQSAAGCTCAPRVLDNSGFNSTAFGGAGNVFPDIWSSASSDGEGGQLPITNPNVTGTYGIGYETQVIPFSGTTAQRPTTNRVTGLAYFDTTLGIPISWNGVAWVNAAGLVV